MRGHLPLTFRSKQAPALYRRQPSDPRLRLRYLLASDLVVLRNILFSGERFKRNSGKKAKATPCP